MRAELLNFTGKFTEDLPESTQEMVELYTKQYYKRFQPLEQ
jgi:dynactin 5